MRIILLRLLLSWWTIPLSWVILLPLFYLVEGKSAIESVVDFDRFLWNGL